MDKYKNEEYLRYEIMKQSRHQFIYGYNNSNRKLFLQELDKEFTINVDCNLPMAIYLNEFGLPKIDIDNSKLNIDKIDILSREYLSFTVAHAILSKSRENIDVDLLNSKLKKLFVILNKYSKNSKYNDITNLDELITVFEQSKEFYKMCYTDYAMNGKVEKSIDEITLPFLQLELFVSQYKKALNNNSYFGIIVDKHQDIALSSTKAINCLVSSRINKDISMKIVVEPDKWDLYTDFSGQYIEPIHDYGVVELDTSQADYVKRLKKCK